jgi:hypothetical protein
MTDEELASLVASLLDALLAVAAIGGGVYLFWKTARKGPMPREHVAVIVFLILFVGVMIFLFTHFVKGG